MDYLDQIYEQNFEMYYDLMTRRKETDPDFTKDDMIHLLESSYAAQGSNWIGRSEAKDTAMSAMIAAYEVVLSNW
jgi:hypothetical protein